MAWKFDHCLPPNERIRELIAQATNIEEPEGLFPREIAMTLEQRLLDLLTAIDNDLYQYVEKPHLYDGVYYLADVSLAAHDALEIAQRLFDKE